jgi:hypothetical protein
MPNLNLTYQNKAGFKYDTYNFNLFTGDVNPDVPQTSEMFISTVMHKKLMTKIDKNLIFRH